MQNKTRQNKTWNVIKLTLCALLCLPLAVVHWQSAMAQTSPAPATASTTTAPTAAPTAAPIAAPAAGSPGPQVNAGSPAQPAPPPAAPPTTAPPPAAPLPSGQSPPVIQVSILGMVSNADAIVQGVMLFLLFCSAACWAAFFYKSIVLARAQRNTRGFSAAFRNAVTMDDAGEAVRVIDDGAARQMFSAARQEWDLTLKSVAMPLTAHQSNRLLQRLVLAMGTAQERAMTRLGSGMGLLATVGSTAPFIGLFGTVWGILDSFEHISASSSTSLAVVAPGIAEALLATAVGLFTAIPATMFYNRFAREIGKVTGQLDNVAAELVVFASRDVERLGK